jgi:hypothetical protein
MYCKEPYLPSYRETRGNLNRKENLMVKRLNLGSSQRRIQQQLEVNALLVDSATICLIVTTHILRRHLSSSSLIRLFLG